MVAAEGKAFALAWCPSPGCRCKRFGNACRLKGKYSTLTRGTARGLRVKTRRGRGEIKLQTTSISELTCDFPSMQSCVLPLLFLHLLPLFQWAFPLLLENG